MPRLSRAQEATRHTVAQLAGAGLPPEQLASRLMAALSGAIPNDGYRLFGVDPGTLLVNRLLAASANDDWARGEWLREVYLAADPLSYIELPALMRHGLTVVAHHEQQDACWGYPPELLAGLTPCEHRDAFHEIRSPVGGTILASFAAGGRWVAALQLYRREPGREFARTDVAFLRLLAPTIGRALAAALARERALATMAGPDASGILVLDPDRRVQLLTPAAETWGRLLRDAGGTGESSLPTAVWSAIAGLQAAGDARVAGRVMAVTAAGQVQIEASPAGPDGSIAVVFAPRRPPAPPELPPDWPLTQQESQVVVLVLRGLGDRQIAEQLFVTENTVRTHLRHIYDKLDVGSRTQLFARYFRETIWPGLDG